MSPEDLDSITAGVRGYERFQQLSQQFVALTEQATWDRQKPEIKKIPALLEAYLPTTCQRLARLQKEGVKDFSALETELLQALKEDGCRLLENVLNDLSVALPNRPALPGEQVNQPLDGGKRKVSGLQTRVILVRDPSPPWGQGWGYPFQDKLICGIMSDAVPEIRIFFKASG